MNNKFVIEENMPDDLKLALQYMNNHNLDFSTKIDEEEEEIDEDSEFEGDDEQEPLENHDLLEYEDEEIDDFLGGIGV